MPFGGIQQSVGDRGLDAFDRLVALGEARLGVQVADDGVDVRVCDGPLQQFFGAGVLGRLDSPVGQRLGQPNQRLLPLSCGDPQSGAGLASAPR